MKAQAIAQEQSRSTASASATATATASSAGATATASASAIEPNVVPPPGKFWGWFNYKASDKNPMTCLADREIRGKPAQCSTVEIFPRQGNETEDQWTTRAAASQGVVGNNKNIGKVQ
jgi:hypothetical protein